MGLWGTKKVRSRSCQGMMDDSATAISINAIASVAATDYHVNYMEAFLESASKSFYTKLIAAQKWAKKWYPWGLLDTNSRISYNVDRSTLFNKIQSTESEDITLLTVSTGSADPLTLALPDILAEYPDYDPNEKVIHTDDLDYAYNGATINKSGLFRISYLEFVADEEHSIIFPVEASLQSNFLYVCYLAGEDKKYYFEELTDNLPSYITKKEVKFQNDYFFIVPFRLKETRLKYLAKKEPNNYKNLWNKSKKLLKKLNLDLELIDSKAHGWDKSPKKDDGSTQGDLSSIDEAYIYFGVPINGTSKAINEYIFKYCLYLKKVGSTNVVCGDSSWNDGIHLQDYVSGINVDWGEVIVDYCDHKGKIGEYYKERQGNNFVIMKQLAKGRAKRITVTKFSITDIIYNEYCTTHKVPDNLNQDTNDTMFLLPLSKSVLKTMGFSARNQVCLHALRLVLDYHEKVKKHFAESKLGMIFSYVFYAPLLMGVPFLQIPTIVGTAQGLFQVIVQNKNPTGLARLVLKYANKANELTMLPIKTLFKVLGPEFGLVVLIIIIIVVSIFTFGAGGAAVAGSTAGATASGTATATAATAASTATTVGATAGSFAGYSAPIVAGSSTPMMAFGTAAASSFSWTSVASLALSSVMKAYQQSLQDNLIKQQNAYARELEFYKNRQNSLYEENRDLLMNTNINMEAGMILAQIIQNKLLVSNSYYETLIDFEKLFPNPMKAIENILDPKSMEKVLNQMDELLKGVMA